jgi:hypothetical protein
MATLCQALQNGRTLGVVSNQELGKGKLAVTFLWPRKLRHLSVRGVPGFQRESITVLLPEGLGNSGLQFLAGIGFRHLKAVSWN